MFFNDMDRLIPKKIPSPFPPGGRMSFAGRDEVRPAPIRPKGEGFEVRSKWQVCKKSRT